MPTTAAEELAKQTLNAIQGLEERFSEILNELPNDRQQYWRDRFQSELHTFESMLAGSKH